MHATADIDKLKKAHEGLYMEMMADRQLHPEIFREESYRTLLVSKARSLVSQLGDTARRVDLLDDYTWLANAVLQWQIAFSSVLEEPLKEGIPDPPKALRASYPVDFIENKLKQYAELISLWRRLGQGSSKEEQDWDWHQAEVCFACDVLDGNINFVQKMEENGFMSLERVWFREILKVKAYFRWWDRGHEVRQSDEDRMADYFYACHYYRWRLLGRHLKYGQEHFNDVKAYLEKNFLDSINKKLVPSTKEKLICGKAEQYWKLKRLDGRNRAESYVGGFYEHIIPAVVASDEASKQRIVEAILESEGPKSPLSIMNAFEAAIAIYFLTDLKGLPQEWYQQAEELSKSLDEE